MRVDDDEVSVEVRQVHVAVFNIEIPDDAELGMRPDENGRIGSRRRRKSSGLRSHRQRRPGSSSITMSWPEASIGPDSADMDEGAVVEAVEVTGRRDGANGDKQDASDDDTHVGPRANGYYILIDYTKLNVLCHGGLGSEPSNLNPFFSCPPKKPRNQNSEADIRGRFAGLF